jgi:hypothetical protein
LSRASGARAPAKRWRPSFSTWSTYRKGVVLFEEFLKEFLPSIEWPGSEILIAES